jgi:uncharacterized repeat protein (TIGR01451 family)
MVMKSDDRSDGDRYLPGPKITYGFAVTNPGNVTMNDIDIVESLSSARRRRHRLN